MVATKFSHKMLQRNTFIVKVFVSENSILYATDIPNFFIYEKSFWSIDKKGIISEINLIPQLDIMIKREIINYSDIFGILRMIFPMQLLFLVKVFLFRYVCIYSLRIVKTYRPQMTLIIRYAWLHLEAKGIY